MELLDVCTEGLGFGEYPLVLRRRGFGELLDIDGHVAVMGTIVRSWPAPMMAGICARCSISVSTSTGDIESSSTPGAAFIGLPATVCVHPATTIAARTRPEGA